MRFGTMHIERLALAAWVVLALAPPVASAQTAVAPVIKPLLAKAVVSGVADKESYLLDIIWPPSATTGRHIHSGDEYATVLEGELQLNVEGQPPKIVRAGEAYHNIAGVVHETKNVGDKPARSVGVLVIDKGKPPTEPVK